MRIDDTGTAGRRARPDGSGRTLRRVHRLLPMLLIGVMPGVVRAQGVLGTATTTGRYIQIRPIARDTVPQAEVIVDSAGVATWNGIPADCTPGTTVCQVFRSAAVEDAVALTQDVSFTAWGLGMQGLSATFQLRLRADAGGGFTWPRTNDRFDAMLAYAELNRGLMRVRLGRQQTLGGLGFAGFDGLSVRVDPYRFLSVEAFGGRSLARGLSEPRNEALQGLESFLPDRNAYVLGGVATVEPWPGGSMSVRYQRDIWSNRSSLLSERASLDLRTDLPRGLSLLASGDYDFAFNRIGKANATVRVPFGARRGLWLEATARHYIPYFELWTIWGFFDPVGYDEGELQATWRPLPPLTLRAFAARRKYGDTGTEVVFSAIMDHTTRVGGSLHWAATPSVGVDGNYTLERGYGATMGSGDVAVRWQASSALSLGFNGTAFQQIEEFRVGDGTVLGGGLAADYAFPGQTSLRGGYNIYRQTFEGRPGVADWNQSRGWLSLRIGFGRDPGKGRIR